MLLGIGTTEVAIPVPPRSTHHFDRILLLAERSKLNPVNRTLRSRCSHWSNTPGRCNCSSAGRRNRRGSAGRFDLRIGVGTPTSRRISGYLRVFRGTVSKKTILEESAAFLIHLSLSVCHALIHRNLPLSHLVCGRLVYDSIIKGIFFIKTENGLNPRDCGTLAATAAPETAAPWPATLGTQGA